MTNEEQVQAVVADCLDGMMYADEACMRRSSHPDAKSISYEIGDREG